MEKHELACRLIERASYRVPQLAELIRQSGQLDSSKLARAMQALKALEDFVTDETAPDADWWRDYFSLTGDHMILTEEGWIPAAMNSPDVTDEPVEVLDEINAPTIPNAGEYSEQGS